MCKGMSQAEVAHMFSHGFVCFRAVQAATGGRPRGAAACLAPLPSNPGRLHAPGRWRGGP